MLLVIIVKKPSILKTDDLKVNSKDCNKLLILDIIYVPGTVLSSRHTRANKADGFLLTRAFSLA